jgi:hypothetical protein
MSWMTVEGCGTGSGFLHHADEPDLAHFRTRFVGFSERRGRWDGSALLGVGFAEIQRGVDDEGFLFGPARSDDQNEGAGPEVSAGLKGRAWFLERAYASADLNVGVAHIPSAPTVNGQEGPWVPFAAMTAGIGF